MEGGGSEEERVWEMLAQGYVRKAEKVLDQAERGRKSELWKAVLDGYANAGSVVDGKRVYFKVDWGSDHDRMWCESKMMSACVSVGDMGGAEL